MRTFLIWAAVLALGILTVREGFAQGAGEAAGRTDPSALEQRLRERKYRTTDQILDLQNESKGLSAQERSDLYQKYSYGPGYILGAFALNLVLPGAGSLLYGDIPGGISLLVPSVLGLGSLIFFVSLSSSTAHLGYLTGIPLISVAEVAGIILSFRYPYENNEKLKTGLRLTGLDHSGRFYAFSRSGSLQSPSGWRMDIPVIGFEF